MDVRRVHQPAPQAPDRRAAGNGCGEDRGAGERSTQWQSIHEGWSWISWSSSNSTTLSRAGPRTTAGLARLADPSEKGARSPVSTSTRTPGASRSGTMRRSGLNGRCGRRARTAGSARPSTRQRSNGQSCAPSARRTLSGGSSGCATATRPTRRRAGRHRALSPPGSIMSVPYRGARPADRIRPVRAGRATAAAPTRRRDVDPEQRAGGCAGPGGRRPSLCRTPWPMGTNVLRTLCGPQAW